MYGGPSYEGVILNYVAHKPVLLICDVKFMEAIYVTHNHLYNLDPILPPLFWRFTGGSILTSETSEHWRQRRKAMAPAFYKERLRGVVKLAAETVKNSIKRMKIEGETTVDIMDEILKTTSEVIISISMSEDVSSFEIDYWEQGKCTKRPISYCFRATIGRFMARASMPHIIFFPSLIGLNLTA